MTVCGLVTAGVVVLFPESREFRIAPYFWILIAMAVFEGIAFAITRGAPGTVITMESRMIGFMFAIVLMLVIHTPRVYRSSGCSDFSAVYEAFTNAVAVTPVALSVARG